MVFIPGAGTLHKSHFLGDLLVAGPEDLAAGGTVGGRQALHLHVGDDVGHDAKPRLSILVAS